MGPVTSVVMDVPESPSDLFASFKSGQAGQGWKETLSMQGGDGSMLGFEKDDRSLLVNLGRSEDGGTISYSFVARGKLVSVTLAGEAPVVAPFPVDMPMAGAVRAPRCSVAKVLKASGVPIEEVTVSYGPAESWTVVQEDDIKLVPDDC